MGLNGRPPSIIDVCLGDDSQIYLPVLTAVLSRLEKIGETASRKEIDALFPWAGTRPDLNIHLEALLKGVGSEGIEPPTNSV